MGRRRRRGLSYLPDGPRRTPIIVYILIGSALLGAMFYVKSNMVKSVSGDVLDSYSGQPIPNAVVSIKNDPILAHTAGISSEMSVKTDPEGHYKFLQTTEKYNLKVEAINYRPSPVSDFSQVYSSQFRLIPYILRGVVKDENGNPLSRASVSLNENTIVTGPEGDFQFSDAPETGKLVVKATGFRRNIVTFQKTMRQDIELKSFTARGIYLPATNAADQNFLPNIMNLVDSTEINTVVVDMKDETGRIFFDSRQPLAKTAPDNKGRIPNLPEFLKNLHSHNIYAIARQVVFLDPVLTDAKPEWSLKSRATGKLWADTANYNWANPYNTEVWDYNLNLAKELAAAGFDEIQFDYVRFPSQGNLSDIDYGRTSDASRRVDAVNGFLKKARGLLTPLGVYTSVNVFGLAALQADDLGMGTKLDVMADEVDYITPTLYPSSWGKGSFNLDQPATRPFDVIRNSLISAKVLTQKRTGFLRPWLQDFSLDGINYGPVQVREEIKAAENDNLASGGWLLWNANARYTALALNPKPESEIRNNATSPKR